MVNTLSDGSDSDGAICVVFGFRQSFGKTNNGEMRGFFPFPFDCAQGQGQNDNSNFSSRFRDCIGQGDGGCCASGIGEGEVAGLSVFEGLAADDAEGKLDRRGLAGEMDGGDAGKLRDGLAFCFELRAGGGQRAGEDEATEGAVDAAARAGMRSTPPGRGSSPW